MTWQVEWDDRARRELRQLDGSVQRQILQYLRERIATSAPPRRFGKALTGDRVGFWRYPIGDYRLICKIEDDQLVVLVLAVGHRREIYE